MAKAQFHKNQRVYVKSIGTWTEVEKIVPHWTKGLDEPLRITYDVGLGREFLADELEGDAVKPAGIDDAGQWRLFRAIAKLSREAASILNDIDQDAPR
jgi:hypothetical protein